MKNTKILVAIIVIVIAVLGVVLLRNGRSSETPTVVSETADHHAGEENVTPHAHDDHHEGETDVMPHMHDDHHEGEANVAPHDHESVPSHDDSDQPPHRH